jgi:hypothetical protein
MASTFLPSVRDRAGAPLEHMFQRGSGRARVRRVTRSANLRPRHVAGLFFLAAGVFFGLHRLALFLFSWDGLRIRNVEVFCPSDALRLDVVAFFDRRPLGNLLLCDIGDVRRRLEALPWVKTARVRKAYPSALRVEVESRTPYAYIERDGQVLIDRDGIELGRGAAETILSYPLLRDGAGFREGFPDKLALARTSLESLPPGVRSLVEVVDLSDPRGVGLGFRGDPTRLVVSGPAIRGPVEKYLARKADWEARFGPLVSVDLRLDGRAILRPADPVGNTEASGPATEPAKEAD